MSESIKIGKKLIDDELSQLKAVWVGRQVKIVTKIVANDIIQWNIKNLWCLIY